MGLKKAKVVIINTSAAYMGDHATGVWLEETATPYYIFKEAGYEVVLASPKGGPVPIDQGSMAEMFFTDACKKFMHDAEAFGALSHSVALKDIDYSTVDCIYLSGGHGTCTDFVDNAELKGIIEKMYASNKVVGADCHGPIALAQCCKPDGSPLVQGLKCTGFADSEEGAVGLTEKVPFLIESKFKELGGLYEKADDWNPHAVVAGKLITGQNPQSSSACAKAVVDALQAIDV